MLPHWIEALVIYAVSRAVSTALLALMFTLASINHWRFPSVRGSSDFFSFSTIWDALQYGRIAANGYPSTLPVDSLGTVLPNEWAFLPVFPIIARGVMTVTALPFPVVGVLVATLAGAAAAVVLQTLISTVANPTQARWTTLFFCFGPLGFLLQVSYAESLFLALTFAALLAIVKQGYGLFTLLAVLAAFTRPGALALALALGIHFFVRWFSRETFPASERVKVVLAGMAVSAAGLAWPFIADAVTAHPGAYVETELAWWKPLVTVDAFRPFSPWFVMGGSYLGIAGVILVCAAAVIFTRWMMQPSVRQLGPDLHGFLAGYGLYVFAVFLPQQSILRIVMPMTPLLASATFTKTPRRRLAVLITGFSLQPVAILGLWFVGFP